ncbi:hypothetical protein [Nocardia aurea]|uniref:hypothetical protein n=1 Tax=Nocardia aurea TaxID=2144174 RepID=UPI0018E59A22|nr:hypothetical protein [Nocardia aurea]
MVNGAQTGHGSEAEPVLISLTAPARRSLVRGLVCDTGSGAQTGVPRLSADRPDAEIADFLAGIVHTDTGFVARTDSGERALAIIAATVAALCGEDIRLALARPDIAFLTALKPPAVEALRGVLLAIETEAAEAVIGALTVLDVG